MIVILDRGIFVTCLDVPGEGVGPVDLQGVVPSMSGTKAGIGYLELKDITLDHMMRILLPHLIFFRHRVDHPGFDFSVLGPIPFREICVYTPSSPPNRAR
jgi:hypothetical protein